MDAASIGRVAGDDKVLTMCAALVPSGGFCTGAFDAAAGVVGEGRCCGAGLHRFVWDGRSWSVDLAYVPEAGGEVVDLASIDRSARPAASC